MMEAPVSVSLGVIRSLPAKLEQLLSPDSNQRLQLREGDKNKILLLKDSVLELIDKYLKEPSEVEAAPTSTARCWVKEVRELSYDIDDFLDELSNDIHGLHATTASQNNLRGKIAKVREGLSRSRWVTDETSRFRSRLEQAIQRHKRYNLGILKSQPIRIGSNEPPIAPLSKRLVGLDSSVEKLEEWLTGDEEERLRVVSIVGLGGIGKTTLARKLYCNLGRRFDCRAFLTSSQKPDMRRLLTSILLQVRQHQPPDSSELCDLTETIRAHLQHKRYFIIIDDLWAPSTWDIVHQAFPDNKCCSRILITTENGVVAHRCCGYNSEHIFEMDPLKDNESRILFFSTVQCSQSENCEQFNKVSYDIIRKCGGFPLATVTTAALLARKQNDIEQCNYIRRSLSSNLQSNPTLEGMNEVLLFCYNNLPERLKACILYLSIYKEDHIILKDDLVKQWVAEGFICAQEGKDMEEVARTYFDELVNAGMIQPVDIKCNDEVLSCNVHYMILNVIRYKSVQENFVAAIDHTQTNLRLADKVRRLSLNFGDAEDVAQPENLRLLQVRSLSIFGLFKFLPCTDEFQLLRVLILHLWGDQDIKCFNLKTVKLFRLRYLQIESNVTLNIQNQMQGLRYLETLKIDSRVNEVPPDIVHLPGLLHLSLPSDTELPIGIGCMTSLQTLECIDLGRNSEENVISLGKLTNLRDLHFTCSTTSDNLVKKLQCLGAVLSKLSNLKSLTVLPAGSSKACSTTSDNTLETCTSRKNTTCEFGTMSSPPALLEELKLLPRVCIFSLLPKWIGELRLLTILKIEIIVLFSEDIDILGGLPALTNLSLYVHTIPAQMIIFDKEGFSVLKNLKFISATPFIKFMEGAMPTVQRLKLGFSVSTMKQFNLIDVGFKHITGLKVVFAKIGGAGSDESSRRATKFLLEEAFTNHPSPPVINIEWVDFILDRETEMQAGSRIILPSGPSSHMEEPESSSRMQKPVEEEKITRAQKENYQIIKEHDVIVEQDTDGPHEIEVNKSGKVTSKHHVTRSQSAHQGMHCSNTGGSQGCSQGVVERMRVVVEPLRLPFLQIRRPNTRSCNLPILRFSASIISKKLQVEVNYLGQFCHRNLVKLIGYCIEDEERLLVYEFVPCGSLEDHLFSSHRPLPWNSRMKIALGAAKGLAYLHSTEAKIIYRHFKTSSILLDMDYSAKISYFQLAKDGSVGEGSHVSTTVIMETNGYAAPEYILTDQLSAKSDTYSFGVVLLEILSGRRAIDKKRRQREHNLVEWARPYLAHKEKISRIVDPSLEGQYPLNGAQTIASLALQCISCVPKMRPSMDAVVTILEKLQEDEAENYQYAFSYVRLEADDVSGSKSSTKSRRKSLRGKETIRPNPKPLVHSR